MDIILDPQYFAIVPVLIAMLSALKSAGIAPRYIPTLAIAAGLLIGGFIANWEIIEMITIGGGIGLTAIGAHSGIKNTLKK